MKKRNGLSALLTVFLCLGTVAFSNLCEAVEESVKLTYLPKVGDTVKQKVSFENETTVISNNVRRKATRSSTATVTRKIEKLKPNGNIVVLTHFDNIKATAQLGGKFKTMPINTSEGNVIIEEFNSRGNLISVVGEKTLLPGGFFPYRIPRSLNIGQSWIEETTLKLFSGQGNIQMKSRFTVRQIKTVDRKRCVVLDVQYTVPKRQLTVGDDTLTVSVRGEAVIYVNVKKCDVQLSTTNFTMEVKDSNIHRIEKVKIDVRIL